MTNFNENAMTINNVKKETNVMNNGSQTDQIIQRPNDLTVVQPPVQSNAATVYQQQISANQFPTVQPTYQPQNLEQPSIVAHSNVSQANLPIQSNTTNPNQQKESGTPVELEMVSITEDKFETINPSGWYALAKGKKGRKFKSRFANYRITSATKIIYVDKNGRKYRYIEIKLSNEDGRIQAVKLPYPSWSSNLMKVIERECEGFITAADKFSNSAALHKRFCDEVMKKLIDEGKVLTQFVYLDWGWSEPLNDGSRIFYAGNMDNCFAEKCLLPKETDNYNHQKNLFDAINNLMALAPSEVILPIATHIFSAYMDKIYRDAHPSYGNRFVLFLIGDSGIGKSVLLTSLCNVCAPEEDRFISVRSTQAGTEEMIKDKGHDDCIFLDDFNMEGTYAEVKERMQVIKSIIRTKSDLSERVIKNLSKSKNIQNLEKIENPEKKASKDVMRGSIICNGEIKLISEIVSGTLRYLIVQLNQPVNRQALTIFQTTNLWKYLVSEWIRFLQKNYITILNYIKEEFPKRRVQYQINENRLRDAFIQQVMTHEIFTWFLTVNGVLTEDGRRNLYNDFFNILTNIVNQQSQLAQKQAPHLLYLKELWNLINDKLKIADSIDSYNESPSEFIGYRQDGIIYLKRDEAYKAVISAFARRREWFPTTVDEVSRLLKRDNLIITDSEGFLKRTSSLIEGRPRMLALVEEACLQFMDSEK